MDAELPPVEITSLRKHEGRPSARGHRIVAYFDAKVASFLLAGCALIRKADGSFNVSPPTLDMEEVRRRRPPRAYVNLLDNDLRQAMTMAAKQAYAALGGVANEPSPEVMDAAAKELAAWLSR